MGSHLPKALMLIQTKVGVMDKVYEKVKKLAKVQRSAMITGPYDVMAIVEAENVGEITRELIENVRDIDGVKETTTNIFIE